MHEEKLVPRLAALARLELSDQEAERLEHEIKAILHHVERLQELPLDEVQATYWTAADGMAMRKDEPGACLQVEDALACAAERDERYLVVPSMREDG